MLIFVDLNITQKFDKKWSQIKNHIIYIYSHLQVHISNRFIGNINVKPTVTSQNITKISDVNNEIKCK